MGMKMTTPMAQIDAYIDRKLDEWVEECISNLEFVGEECVAEARTSGSYTDRTGNLRSSVGYVVVKDGKIVKKGGFQHVNGTKKSDKNGEEDGEQYAESLVGRYPEGIVLIVVAGMNYAAYVSAKGFNVLDSAELKAESIIKKLFANG